MPSSPTGRPGPRPRSWSTEPPGYALRLDPDQVDAYRFERLAGEGRSPAGRRRPAGRPRPARRGPVPLAGPGAGRLRLRALRHCRPSAGWTSCGRPPRRTASRPAWRSGDHAGASTALPPLIAAHPLRERLARPAHGGALPVRSPGRSAARLRGRPPAPRRRAGDRPRPRPPASPPPAARPGPGPGRRRPAEVDARRRRPCPAPIESRRGQGAPGQAVGGPRRRRWRCSTGPGTAALDGHTRFVVIAGEPGIGKTTLAEELASRAEASGAAVAWGRCHDDEGALPLWPWAQVVRGPHAGGGAPRAPAPRPRRPPPRAGRAGGACGRRRRPLPPLRRRPGQPSSGPARLGPWSSSSTTCTGPTPSSLRLLRFLMVETKDARLLVVVTLRDTEGDTGELLAATLGDLARTQGPSGSCSPASPSRTWPSWSG